MHTQTVRLFSKLRHYLLILLLWFNRLNYVLWVCEKTYANSNVMALIVRSNIKHQKVIGILTVCDCHVS